MSKVAGRARSTKAGHDVDVNSHHYAVMSNLSMHNSENIVKFPALSPWVEERRNGHPPICGHVPNKNACR